VSNVVSQFDEPPYNVLDQACPSRTVFNHVTGKWGALVLVALADNELRFGELARRVDGISDSMLSKVLRDMHADGLIERADAGTNPPQVSYRVADGAREVAMRAAHLADSVQEMLETRRAAS
jgi:DNA-binding HxlR family transcriptional regulator